MHTRPEFVFCSDTHHSDFAHVQIYLYSTLIPFVLLAVLFWNPLICRRTGIRIPFCAEANSSAYTCHPKRNRDVAKNLHPRAVGGWGRAYGISRREMKGRKTGAWARPAAAVWSSIAHAPRSVARKGSDGQSYGREIAYAVDFAPIPGRVLSVAYSSFHIPTECT
jgi:hypothetical protein